MLESITITEHAGIKLIHITYEQIDMFNIVTIVSEISELPDSTDDYLFDFSNIRFIDSSGLGGLIKIQKKLQQEGRKLGLCNLNRNIENLLHLTQTLKYLPRFASVKEGLKKLPETEIEF